MLERVVETGEDLNPTNERGETPACNGELPGYIVSCRIVAKESWCGGAVSFYPPSLRESGPFDPSVPTLVQQNVYLRV